MAIQTRRGASAPYSNTPPLYPLSFPVAGLPLTLYAPLPVAAGIFIGALGVALAVNLIRNRRLSAQVRPIGRLPAPTVEHDSGFDVLGMD